MPMMSATPAPSATAPARIVLYVDASKTWHQAGRLVAQYVRQMGGHVTVVSSALLPRTRERVLADARRVLALSDDQLAVVGRAGLTERVVPDVAREARADLVVVGHLGALDALTNHYAAHAILKRTRCSVLFVRGRLEGVRSAVVCTEGSRFGAANFEAAAVFARAFAAKLTVLHVLSQMGLESDTPTVDAAHIADFLASDDPVAQHLRDLDARMHELGLDGAIKVRLGLVVDEIRAEVGSGHDLLVIGAHVTDDGGALLEDVADDILHASPVSTLVVRGAGR